MEIQIATIIIEVDLLGWIKTNEIKKTAAIKIFFSFCSKVKVSLVKYIETSKTKASLAISAGWKETEPIKGISGRGLGFKTNHLIAPLLQGANGTESQGKNLATASKNNEIKEI